MRVRGRPGVSVCAYAVDACVSLPCRAGVGCFAHPAPYFPISTAALLNFPVIPTVFRPCCRGELQHERRSTLTLSPQTSQESYADTAATMHQPSPPLLRKPEPEAGK